MGNTAQAHTTKSIQNLLKVISDLRDPLNGCPWDLEQTHSSLIPYVLEEAHEVADAIREADDINLIEELGDLLLQIMLHAQIAEEEKRFCLNDVVKGITTKLIRRHPHVFDQQKVLTPKEVNKAWEEIKLSEKPISSSIHQLTERLKVKTRSQPAMQGAMKISKQVTKVGFEWRSIDEVWGKFNEELDELKEALNNTNKINAQEELGDVLFTLINIARWHELDPEEGLAGTNKRFLERFEFIETKLNGNLSNQSIEKLELLWEQAKQHIASEKIQWN